MTEAPLVSIQDLRVYFPILGGVLRRKVGEIRAVDGVDLDIGQGEIVALVGESGSGKSTVARAMNRLVEPTSGKVLYRGKDLASKKDLLELRKEIQFVFQDPATSLNPRKSVGRSIGESLVYHGIVKSWEEAIDHVEEVMQQVGLRPELQGRYPHELSGGQQQRVCIGRAIVMKPRLIICDEVVSALDVSVRAQILNLLLDLQEKLGLSYLFISHDLSVVRHIADQVLVMNRGVIVERGAREDLFANPRHPYTQKLLSAIPKIPEDWLSPLH